MDGAAFFDRGVVFEQTKVLGLVDLAVGVLDIECLLVGLLGKA